ncbi:MAG: hypothetical protein ABL867_08980 [Rickettsiales bacterium]
MSEPKDIQVSNQPSRAVIPNNDPTRSIHSELIEAIKAQGLNDPNFKFQVNKGGAATTRIDTTLPVEGDKRLTILLKTNGSAEFYKADPKSQFMGKSLTADGGIEQTVSTSGKTTVFEQSEWVSKSGNLLSSDALGVTHDPRQSVKDFRDLVSNQKLVKGLNAINQQAGTLIYNVKAGTGDGVYTEIEINHGGSKAKMHALQEGGKVKIPGAGVNDIDTVLKNVAEAAKPPAPAKQIEGKVFTVSEIRELGDKIPKIKLGIGAGIGILAPQLAEAAIGKAPKEPPKGADRMVGIMGPIGYALNETAKAISGSKDSSKKEVGSVLSEADKRMAAEIAKQFDNFGIPAPTSDVVANQHISSKSQQTSRATPGS